MTTERLSLCPSCGTFLTNFPCFSGYITLSDILKRIYAALTGAKSNVDDKQISRTSGVPSRAPQKDASETRDEKSSSKPTVASAPAANQEKAPNPDAGVSTPTPASPAEPIHVDATSSTPDENELDAYDYELPERLIAQFPLQKRDQARLLVVNRKTQKLEHRHFYNIVEYLNPEDVLVLNNTKVLPARLIGSRTRTGGRWEGLFLQYDPRGFWEIMSKTRGYLQPGEHISLMNSRGTGITRELEVVAHTEQKTLVVRPILEEGEDSFTFLDKVGWIPIPPYIRGGRMTPSDRDDYQTVYAQEPGAVAAPTAGLHFTKELLDQIREIGVAVCDVTLHVGAGTFKPITVTKLSEHHMHSEYATISEDVVRVIEERKARGGRVFAIGTTSVRTLESASNARPDGSIDSSGVNDLRLRPFAGQTDLFIRPPYRFKTVDAILTNFHLPKSTLVILVRTFGGDELIKHAYEEAIAEDYRFYSYGDAMLIL